MSPLHRASHVPARRMLPFAVLLAASTLGGSLGSASSVRAEGATTPATTAATSGGSTFDRIRKIDEETRQRRTEFEAQIRAMDMLIENMKRLAFEIDLRIAKIRNGEFERDCDGADEEMQAIVDILASIEQMRGETEKLCSSTRPENAEAAAICNNRRADLDGRVAGLEGKRRALAQACPAAEPKRSK